MVDVFIYIGFDYRGPLYLIRSPSPHPMASSTNSIANPTTTTHPAAAHLLFRSANSANTVRSGSDCDSDSGSARGFDSDSARDRDSGAGDRDSAGARDRAAPPTTAHATVTCTSRASALSSRWPPSVSLHVDEAPTGGCPSDDPIIWGLSSHILTYFLKVLANSPALITAASVKDPL